MERTREGNVKNSPDVLWKGKDAKVCEMEKMSIE